MSHPTKYPDNNENLHGLQLLALGTLLHPNHALLGMLLVGVGVLCWLLSTVNYFGRRNEKKMRDLGIEPVS